MASRKIRTVEERFWSKVDKSAGPDGCWLWTGGRYLAGYGQFHICNHPKRAEGPARRTVAAHRVSFEIANGQVPENLCVCHRCDIRACVNPAHLFAGTNTDNMHDKVAKGRARGGSLRGEENGRAKLSAADIPIIRARYAAGECLKYIAADYGVGVGAIYNVASRRCWQHVA